MTCKKCNYDLMHPMLQSTLYLLELFIDSNMQTVFEDNSI